jgi:hypothetical protein
MKKVKPEVRDILKNPYGVPNPRFQGLTRDVPAKLIQNTKGDMDLLRLYAGGPLKWENTGKTCGNCVNYYPDPNIGSKMGRCRARGFLRVHEDTAADERHNYSHPAYGDYFSVWPACPLYTEKSRLSRR